MNIKELLEMLKENRISIVAKEIGISQKKLSKAMKAVGYQYNRSVGWHYTSKGEPPLEADIRDFIGDTDNARSETTNEALTENEVNVLREIINGWDTTQNVVNTIMQQKEKISAQKDTNPIHSLYMRIGEIGAQEKVSRTVNLNKGTCSQLGTFEDVLRINRDDIIEIALREFFEKYKAQ
ncbi:CopG family transcriptional regulator [Bacillus thuringiensis]|nr:CopG family transcriptional regulator [Bacillus thuringiensis]